MQSVCLNREHERGVKKTVFHIVTGNKKCIRKCSVRSEINCGAQTMLFFAIYYPKNFCNYIIFKGSYFAAKNSIKKLEND